MASKQLLAALTLALATTGVGVFSSGAASASAPNGAKLLSQVQATVASQRGFQWSDKGIEEGTTEYETTYVGKGVGSQSVTIDQTGGRASLSVLVVGTTAYVEGNAKGLVLLGFVPSAAQSEAGKWVSVPEAANQALYENLAGGLTSSSVATNLSMSAPVTELRQSRVLGQNVLGLKGTAAPAANQQTGTTDTLYVAARGAVLPVELIQDNASVGNTYTFSHWGHAPSVKAPRGAVAFEGGWV